MPRAKPGERFGGRQKGTPNKIPAQLKEIILEALHGAHKDGAVAYLKWLAVEHPPAFSGLVGKVLPMTVAGDPTAPVKTVQRVEWVVVDAAKTSAAIENSNRPGVSPTLN